MNAPLTEENSRKMGPDLAHRILSPVTYEKGFHFFLDSGSYSGETAVSLLTFALDLETIETKSIKYHFERGDFQNWIANTLGDEELANRIGRIGRQASNEELQKELITLVRKRIAELQTLHASH